MPNGVKQSLVGIGQMPEWDGGTSGCWFRTRACEDAFRAIQATSAITRHMTEEANESGISKNASTATAEWPKVSRVDIGRCSHAGMLGHRGWADSERA